MSDKVEQEILDKAFRAPTTRIIRKVSDVPEEEKDFEIDLESLNNALADDDLIVEFENPNGGKPIQFWVREPTAEEWKKTIGSLFSEETLELANIEIDKEEIKEKTKDDPKLVENYKKKKLSLIKLCIVKPTGITIQMLQGWSPHYINTLYNAIARRDTINSFRQK